MLILDLLSRSLIQALGDRTTGKGHGNRPSAASSIFCDLHTIIEGIRPMAYHFRIRTASGGILNTSQWGHNIENAKYRLFKRYPGATIIDMY